MNKDGILVINCGSSSLKYSLINPDNGDVFIEGIAQRLTTKSASISINYSDNNWSHSLASPHDHKTAIAALVELLREKELVKHIVAVGHRVVHGGESYAQPTLITNEVKQTILALAKIAPLHNPANLIGIEAAEAAFDSLPQVAIFDTAFHQTMPSKAYLYGLPYSLYKKHSIRKYGFHGTSHYFVAKQAASLLDKPFNQCNLISAHLGNGCSVTAVKNGLSVDSSMGFTPLEGVMMGSRSGSIDPGIIFHLIEQLNYTPEQVNHMLNKESGLLGISELSNDCRALEEAMNIDGNALAKLALDMFSYQIAKSISSLSASLSELDGIVFTGGIGENSSYVREQIVAQLSLLNISLDHQKNKQLRFGRAGNIAQSTSRPCLVIPTNEEWVIAEQTFELLNKD